MTQTIRLFAALALALALAGCASDDAEESTDASAETTVVQDESTDSADTDDAAEMEDRDSESSESSEMEDHGSGDFLPVTGELGYDGIAIEAGSTLVLTLTDLTDANPESALKAAETIELDDSASSPIPFEIMIPRNELDRNLRYSLRAIINDVSGEPVLTTNAANFIDVEADASDLGSLELVSAD